MNSSMRIVLMLAHLFWLSLLPINFALAQPAKSGESTEALLRSIGVTKAPFSATPAGATPG